MTHRNLTSFEWVSTQQVGLRGGGCANVWFQKDGVTAHTEHESVTIVRNMFPGHLISRFGDMPWPPRSPDLSTCVFFFGWYLKSCVYAHNPCTLNDLKEAIRQEI